MQFKIVFFSQKINDNCLFQGKCLPFFLYLLANRCVVNHMLQSGGEGTLTEPTKIPQLNQNTRSI